MEEDLSKFIWAPCHVVCTAILIGWQPKHPPPAFGLVCITRALLVSKDRRHIFITPRGQAFLRSTPNPFPSPVSKLPLFRRIVIDYIMATKAAQWVIICHMLSVHCFQVPARLISPLLYWKTTKELGQAVVQATWCPPPPVADPGMICLVFDRMVAEFHTKRHNDRCKW
jgi:hypothetical protein